MSLAIINKGTYGGSSKDGCVSISLLRTPVFSAHPIKERPIADNRLNHNHIDIGEREFEYRLTADASYIDKDAEMFNQPPYSLSFFPSGDGIKKETELSLSNENIIMTAYKALTDDKKLIRLFNSLGTDTKAKLINNDNSFEIVFAAYEVKTMILTDNSLRETDMLSE